MRSDSILEIFLDALSDAVLGFLSCRPYGVGKLGERADSL